jgi:hypothetical protein
MPSSASAAATMTGMASAIKTLNCKVLFMFNLLMFNLSGCMQPDLNLKVI